MVPTPLGFFPPFIYLIIIIINLLSLLLLSLLLLLLLLLLLFEGVCLVDTTVILAQPRENKAPSGCRLRGSVGLASGSLRARFGRAGDPSWRQFWRTFWPPRIWPTDTRIWHKKSWYCGVIWPPRVWSTDTRIFSPIGRWHPCACAHWIQNLSYGYSKKSDFLQKMPLRAPDIQGIPRGW